jgi:hypothetical protein
MGRIVTVPLSSGKPIGGTQAIIANFKFACLNIDRDNFTQMSLFNLRPDFGFVECITALGKFLFAVSGLPDCHQLLHG